MGNISTCVLLLKEQGSTVVLVLVIVHQSVLVIVHQSVLVTVHQSVLAIVH